MTLVQANLLCIALVAADFVARTWRTQCFLRGLGYHSPFGEVLVQIGLGEAASSLTPLRLGGEPARVWAMNRAGISTTPAIVCLGVEYLAMAPVIVVAAGVLTWAFAPEWWAAARPSFVRAAAG